MLRLVYSLLFHVRLMLKLVHSLLSLGYLMLCLNSSFVGIARSVNALTWSFFSILCFVHCLELPVHVHSLLWLVHSRVQLMLRLVCSFLSHVHSFHWLVHSFSLGGWQWFLRQWCQRGRVREKTEPTSTATRGRSVKQQGWIQEKEKQRHLWSGV